MTDESMFPDALPETPEDTIVDRDPIEMTVSCDACMGEGRVAVVDDDGEPVLFKSGKREGEPRDAKCEVCTGDGVLLDEEPPEETPVPNDG